MSKQKKLLILISCVALLSASAWFAFNYSRQSRSIEIEMPALKRTQVERNLTSEERKIYEDKLQKAQDYLKELRSRRGVVEADEYFKAYMNIGFVYNGLGELQKAAGNYLQAIKEQENNYNGYTALYLAYLESGDFDKSRQAIEKAVEIGPQVPDNWRKYLELEQGKFYVDFKRQDELYTLALDKTSRHPDILFLYSRFLEQEGKLQEALKILEEIQKIKSSAATLSQIKSLEDQLKKK